MQYACQKGKEMPLRINDEVRINYLTTVTRLTTLEFLAAINLNSTALYQLFIGRQHLVTGKEELNPSQP